jgi:predicted transcriptional regulator
VPFELQVVNNTPLTGDGDPRSVARTFLTQIGYLSPNSDGEIPFRLFYEAFLLQAEKPWHVEELENFLATSRPTVYRHLNKLKGFDLLEEVALEDPVTGQTRKAYRLRYGNLAKAWHFVEAHLKVAIDNYAKTVEHLSSLVTNQVRTPESAPTLARVRTV